MAGSSTGERGKSITRRRDVLRAMTTGLAVAAVGAVSLGPTAAPAETETVSEKRKARYQANSPEVQEFYRVNRYPTH
jgi:hypothetical protein